MRKGGKSIGVLNKTNVKLSENHQMKVLIVYDSVYGNTEKIAKAIGDAITGRAGAGSQMGERNLNILEEGKMTSKSSSQMNQVTDAETANSA